MDKCLWIFHLTRGKNLKFLRIEISQASSQKNTVNSIWLQRFNVEIYIQWLFFNISLQNLF